MTEIIIQSDQLATIYTLIFSMYLGLMAALGYRCGAAWQ